MEIEFGNVAMEEVTLVSEVARPTRGRFDEAEAKHELHARISFGEIGVERLVAPSETDWAYELLKFVCSFRANPDEPFDRAWLKVELSRLDGVSERPPIAWSMAPEREAREVQVERAITLTPTLTLSAVSVEAGASRKSTYIADAVYLEALGEKESNAGWEFVHTPQIELRGMHRLAMVVRRDIAVPALARVSMSALVTRHKLIVKYRAKLGQNPTRELVLGRPS